MKILLITTRDNTNPGDQFIRLGVQKLVQHVQPDVEFVRISKEDDEIGHPIEFDKAILCGMPLWWDNPVSHSQSIGWWGPLMRGWVSERKKDFLILGAGSVMGQHEVNMSRYISAIEESVARSYAVVTRQPVLDHPQLISSICPAAFAATWNENRTRYVCNLMPAGAHDRHFNPEEADLWEQRLPEVAGHLKKAHFEFCAHNEEEKQLAQQLGWLDQHIHFFDTPEEYLEFYKNVRVYAGNRMHGAVVVAAGGGIASVQGYDSRMEMVKRFTPRVFLPSESFKMSLPVVTSVPLENRTLVAREFIRQAEIVRNFLNA